MSFPIFQNSRLSPNPVPLIHPQIPRIFSEIGSDDQRHHISQLEYFIEQIRADGSIIHLLQLGALSHENMHERYSKKEHLLERCYWQLAQFYRYSTPSRISEGVPAIRFVIDFHGRINPDLRTTTNIWPSFYLGVALSRGRVDDKEALDVLSQTLAVVESAPGIHGRQAQLLWPRAELSRVLRRLGRIVEAEEEEAQVRQLIRTNPLKPSEVERLVLDDQDEGVDYILTHPDAGDLYKDARFQGANATVMFGQF